MKRMICLMLVAGCAVEDDEAVETAEQGVSSTSMTTHTCLASQCTWDIGWLANSTCFLAGLTGNVAGVGLQPDVPIGANIVAVGAQWQLQISADGGAQIAATTVCISNTANRSHATWSTASALQKRPIGPASVGRMCFLSGVMNDNPQAFSTFASNVKVYAEGGTYWVEGTFPVGSHVEADVTCVDGLTGAGAWSLGNGTIFAFADDLALNPRAGGVACALTGIGGELDLAGQGVAIGYDAATRYWNWSVDPMTGGDARCFK